MLRSMCLLNQYGDTTITWSSENDERMLDVIRSKMKAGVMFFIIDSTLKTVPIKSAFDVGPERKIIIDDSDFDQLFHSNIVSFAKRDTGEQIRTTGIAHTAEAVASNNTVGIQQMKGG